MLYVALVTLLMLIQYFIFTLSVGLARGKYNIEAPKTSGNEVFERKLRIQLNTLEQLAMALPAMWVCAHYFNANLAALLGAAFILGRAIYSIAYTKEPSKRSLGMIIGILSCVAMVACSLWAIISQLLA